MSNTNLEKELEASKMSNITLKKDFDSRKDDITKLEMELEASKMNNINLEKKLEES